MSEAASFRLPARWVWVLVAGFAALSVLGMLNHEPWRDEAQAWFIAKDCTGPAALIEMAGYEGHPLLWHLILMPFARAGLPFFSAALVHFGIILAAVILFLRRAPFPRHQRALFIFGYYILYEYNVIVRNYAVSVLLLFAIAAAYRQRFKKPLVFAALLALLANTNLFGLVIVLLLAAVYVIDVRRSENPAIDRRRAFAALLAAGGIAIAAYQIWLPRDVLLPMSHRGQVETSLFNLDFSVGHLSVITRALVGAFLPVPQEGPHFWNSRLVHYPLQAADWLKGLPWGVRWAYGTVVVFPALLSLGFLVRRTIPFLFYLVSSCALLGVFFLVYAGSVRHHGFLFMLFIFSLWISASYGDNRLAEHPRVKKWLGAGNLSRLLTGFLVVHVAASAAALHNEWKYDFSSGKKAAAFLKAEGLLSDRVFIATYPSKTACSILLHVDAPHPSVYMIEYQRNGSYMIWNGTYTLNMTLPMATVVERIDAAIASQEYERVILITNSKVDDGGLHDRYQLIASFNATVDRQESFCIFELRKPRP